MKAFLILTILYSLCVSPTAADSALSEYCDAPDRAFQILADFRTVDWNTVSAEQIQSKWPTSLHKSLDCGTSDSQTESCVVYQHRAEDEDFCCCNVSFYFDVPLTGALQFNSVVLNVANRDRDKVLSFLQKYLKSMTPLKDEIFADPWEPPGITFSYDPRSILNAYSFISPRSQKITITVALQPLGDVADNYYWWLRLTMVK